MAHLLVFMKLLDASEITTIDYEGAYSSSKTSHTLYDVVENYVSWELDPTETVDTTQPDITDSCFMGKITSNWVV